MICTTSHSLYNLRYVTMTIKVQEACKDISLLTNNSTHEETRANELYKIRQGQHTQFGTTVTYILTTLCWLQDHHIELSCLLTTADDTIKPRPKHLLLFDADLDEWIGSQLGCGRIRSLQFGLAKLGFRTKVSGGRGTGLTSAIVRRMTWLEENGKTRLNLRANLREFWARSNYGSFRIGRRSICHLEAANGWLVSKPTGHYFRTWRRFYFFFQGKRRRFWRGKLRLFVLRHSCERQWGYLY